MSDELDYNIRETLDEYERQFGESIMVNLARAELEKLRDQLTIKTLENIKGSSVLDDKNVELARLRRVAAAAREVIKYHEHDENEQGYWNGEPDQPVYDVRDDQGRDNAITKLAAELGETEPK